jgi:hypothetical protein
VVGRKGAVSECESPTPPPLHIAAAIINSAWDPLADPEKFRRHNVMPNPSHPYVDLSVEDFCDDDTDPYADVRYWSKLPYWTAEEGTALSFGYEPRVVAAELLPHRDHPFTVEYEQRRERAIRAQDIGQLQAHILPVDYINWAKRGGVPFPSNLEGAVREQSKTKNGTEGVETVHPRARNTTSKILLGMAMAGYKYDPAKRSHVSKEIADDLMKLGIPVGDDTVRKTLQEAANDVGHLVKSDAELGRTPT